MKRSTITIILSVCFVGLLLTSCTSDKMLSEPEDTALEFWVAQKVTRDDFSEHYEIDGVFGAYMYFGKDYQPIEPTDEYPSKTPKHCVIYTVTAYPDCSSNNGNFDTVTRIAITDPNVSIYGITCNSSLEEFDEVFKDLGCKIQDKGLIHIATYGKTNVAFADHEESETITIWVDVTNKQGINY